MTMFHSSPFHDWPLETEFSGIVYCTKMIGIFWHWHSRTRCDGSGQTPLDGTRYNEGQWASPYHTTKGAYWRRMKYLSHSKASSYLLACNTKLGGGNEWMYPVISIPHPSPSLKRTQRKGNFLSRSVSLQNHWPWKESWQHIAVGEKTERWSWLILLAFLMWEKREKRKEFATEIVREKYRQKSRETHPGPE